MEMGILETCGPGCKAEGLEGAELRKDFISVLFLLFFCLNLQALSESTRLPNNEVPSSH